jgi:predicted tellurium resistance membrane protein TerC
VRDLILFAGGVFLLVKSVGEIHGALEGAEHGHGEVKLRTSLLAVAIQIGLVDIVFSLDSVLTAVGLADHVSIMVAAIMLAVFVMMFLAAPIHEFIERHPTIKILALAFLILIGIALIAESLEFHIPKGYLYFSMAFLSGRRDDQHPDAAPRKAVDLHDRDLRPGRTASAESRCAACAGCVA